MNIKAKIITLNLAAFLWAPLCHAKVESAVDLNAVLQKAVNEYYATYGAKEQFTAIQASVFIPQNHLSPQPELKTVVKGTFGKPPFSQPVSASSLFDIGSITKSFTALLLLQLQAENKLSLDDPLGKWLPQYPNWKEVSLRQLLNMTSGIPNYSEDEKFSKMVEENLAKSWSNEELLTYAHPETPLRKNRDTLYEYSNSNYILAALVIEKVTGDTFDNELKRRIVNVKNGLNNTFYPAGADGQSVQKAIAERKVHGYYFDEDNQKLYDTFDNDLSWAGAAGALVANSEDVIRWVQLLYHGAFFNAAQKDRALKELESVVSLKTGQPIATVSAEDPTGFGLGVAYHYDKESGQKFWIYKGSTLGFRVMYFWQPCNNVTTVVALNSKGGEGAAHSKLGDQIAQANLNLYKLIMEVYPELKCTN